MTTRVRAILLLGTLLLVFAGPILLLIGLSSWSPFGMFNWLHEWIQRKSEERLNR